jgi:RNA polymerase sigma-70 factor (ECF subfamily)
MNISGRGNRATMAAEQSFVDTMTRIRAGDRDATTLVFQRFANRLLALAQSRLDQVTRQKTDPEDVLQSVFCSFFRRMSDQQWEVDSWDSLWGLLAMITVRKCGHRVDYFRAACRDVQREVSTDQGADSIGNCPEPVADDPTPSAAAMLAETVDYLLRGLDGRDRRIVEMNLEGYTYTEIGDRVRCTERTVYRVLERVRSQLRRLRGEEDKGH